MSPVGIGSRIKALRERKGWEISHLARAALVSHSYIYKLEHNERPNVAGVVVSRLADVLDTTTDYLLGRTTDPSPLLASGHELDMENVIRLRQFAERVARLPASRRSQVMDVALRVAQVAHGDESIPPSTATPVATGDG